MAQRFEQLESRAAGKHDIQNNQLVVFVERRGQAGIMVVGGIDVEAFSLQETA